MILKLKLDFVRTLTYCHTAVLMPDAKGQVDIRDASALKACMQAESADEVALVLAAAEHCGVLLLSRSDATMTCSGLGAYNPNPSGHADIETVTILAVNEFDSDRKMMSVLLQLGQGGEILLLCKGADSSVLKQCGTGGGYRRQCESHIDLFACQGLRTLVFACRYLVRFLTVSSSLLSIINEYWIIMLLLLCLS